MRKRTIACGVAVPRELRKTISKLIVEVGFQGACKALEMNRETVARLAAGITVNAGTMLIRLAPMFLPCLMVPGTCEQSTCVRLTPIGSCLY
jgi:hypothetical protein